MTAPGVCLAWALVDGKRVHAETMRGVPHDQRPRAICPCCSEIVVWKAGDVVTPHVAHAPGSSCAATNPETAAHWNAKFHVAELWNRYDFDFEADTAGFKITCRKCRREGQFHWWRRQMELMGYSRVEVEVPVGTRRADVAFVREETAFFNEANERVEWHQVTEEMFDRGSKKVISRHVTAVIEIKHSHAVDARKAEEYKRLGVPWIEISAEDALAWKDLEHAIKPLQVCDLTREAFERECEHCEDIRQAKREAEVQRQNERRRDLALGRLHVQDRYEAPALTLVVAASVLGTRGPTAIAASVLGHNQPVRTKLLRGDYTWMEAIWMAIEFAMDRLHEVAPGRSATIFSKAVTREKQISVLRYGYLGHEPFECRKGAIALCAVERGHVLMHSMPDERLQAAFKRVHARAYAAVRAPVASPRTIITSAGVGRML